MNSHETRDDSLSHYLHGVWFAQTVSKYLILDLLAIRHTRDLSLRTSTYHFYYGRYLIEIRCVGI